jgi:uncharacterized OB-fold protein
MDVGIIRADERSAPFFAAAARDTLLIKRCVSCGHWLDPEATGCTQCGSADPQWEAACGRGTVISWAVLPAGKSAMADAPSVLALVELDEGPWLHTRLEGASHVASQPGLRVIAHFAHPADGESYPVFGPDEAGTR